MPSINASNSTGRAPSDANTACRATPSQAPTPSYIYNIRASIRKKWDLDAAVNLRSAIAERYAQTGTPFPSELKLEE